MANTHASGTRAVGGVLLGIGVASLGVLLWISRRIIVSERAWNLGDLAVLGVFAVFGALCAWWGWQLLRAPAGPAPAAPARTGSAEKPPRRVTVSHGFAAAGVALLILCVLVPAEWYPVVLLFAGLACLVVSHVLTPCEERMEKLKKARASMRQL